MADSALQRLTQRRQANNNNAQPHSQKQADNTPFIAAPPSQLRQKDDEYDDVREWRRWHFGVLFLLILLFLFSLGAYFSPLGSLVFLQQQQGHHHDGDSGTGSGGGGGDALPCEIAETCDPLRVTSLVTEALTSGAEDPTAPVDFFNDEITVHTGSTLTFEAGSSVVCPTDTFLNDCVDVAADTFTPTCEADFVDCGPSTPLTTANLLVTEQATIASGTNLLLEAGSTVTCPTPDFLNACVDEPAPAPTCTEHSACTDLLTTGLDVNGGTLDLLAGADVTTSTGSTINLASGSSLNFDAGASIVCPSTGFLNNCVDEAFTPTCATNYDQCNVGDPLVVGGQEITERQTIASGASVLFETGSALLCPSPDFLNGCVDETFTPSCGTNYDQCNSGDPLVVGSLLVTEDIEMTDGTTLTFAPTSSVVCPTSSFLNDCVDEPFSATCATNYDQCNSGDPLVVGATRTTEQSTIASTAALVFELGSTVTCPDPGFLNDCVDESGLNMPSCNEHAACTNFTVAGIDLIGGGTLDLLDGAGITTSSGTIITVADGATFVLDSGATFTCPNPNFLNDCVEEFYTPVCDEHAACTDFAVSGLNLDGGVLTLLAGADILATAGSQITMPNGAAQIFESGSLLQFNAGASVTCPSAGFLNGCVDEPFTPTCATNYDQCNSGDPLVVGALQITEELTLPPGANLEFTPGSSVTCPSPDFLNDCVDDAFTPTCATNYDQCNSGDPLVVGATRTTEQSTIASTASLVFELGSTVVCPDPGFLNDCVDESGLNTPSCNEHAACTNFTVAGIDLSGGSLDLLDGAGITTSSGTIITVADGATFVLDSGATFTCPDPSFLNDCVEEFYTPVCDEHAACTDFAVSGLNLDGGVLTLLAGADILATAGSQIAMPNGAAQIFESGSLLQFDAGTNVTCPSAGFLNDCVDEPFTPTCGTNYDQCNVGDPLVVGAQQITEEITLQPGANLEFVLGSSVTCPSPGFLNACVDEDNSSGTVYTPTCTEHASCGDFAVTGIDVNGGPVDLLAGAAVTTTAGSRITMSNATDHVFEAGSRLTFDAGSGVTCPTPDFLNSCVDEVAEVDCANDYALCGFFRPPFRTRDLDMDGGIIQMLSSADSEWGLSSQQRMNSGSSLVMRTGSSLFINAGVNVISQSDIDFIFGDISFDTKVSFEQAKLAFFKGTTRFTSTSDTFFNSGANLDFVSGSSVNFDNALGEITCLSPIFDPASGCTTAGTGGGTGTFTPTCGIDYDQCDSANPLVVGAIDVTQELSLGAGAGIAFDPLSTVTCPTTGFLNDCVDESFSPVCATNYDQCDAADPFIVDTVRVLSEVDMPVGASLSMGSGSQASFETGSNLAFASGSDVTCASSIFDEASGCLPDSLFFAPSCAEHASCVGFDVTGLDVNGGDLDLLNGADLTTSTDSFINIANGARLVFSPGSTITCPSPGFFNSCVDESSGGGTTFEPTCGLDYDQCNSADPFVVDTIDLTTELQVSSSAEININGFGRLNVGSSGRIQVDSGGRQFIQNSGSYLDVSDFADIRMTGFGTDLILNAGAEIDVNSGATISINAAGQQVVQDGGVLDVLSGGLVNIQQSANQDVRGELKVLDTGILRVESNLALDDANMFMNGVSELNVGVQSRIEAAGRIKMTFGSLLEIDGSAEVKVRNNANVNILSGGAQNFRSGSTLQFEDDTDVLCAVPVIPRNCIEGPPPPALFLVAELQGVTVASGVDLAVPPMSFTGSCVTGSTLPCPVLSSQWQPPSAGTYTFTLLWQIAGETLVTDIRRVYFDYDFFDSLTGSLGRTENHVACETSGIFIDVLSFTAKNTKMTCSITIYLPENAIFFRPRAVIQRDPFDAQTIGGTLKDYSLTIVKVG